MTTSEELLGPGSLTDEATLRSRWPSSSPRPDGAGAAIWTRHLRSHIVVSMFANSPGNHAVQLRWSAPRRSGAGPARVRGAFARDHSVFRRRGNRASTDALSSYTPVDATTEWRWEGNVQAAVVRHLAALGYPPSGRHVVS